ncbi:ABC transporter substrate-binding protein [Taylorella asinigenitalis]|uniref:Dipeptide-binding ABC transporter, periplasmic substrate-binding component n=1 Tax=Taylorella asinigenitalis (strain MCE3) TaxID=1008459 RepID=G4QCP8_TAYAM|nr:ABC transporter substrate-binding protein [Taylorella asinigenitalis]AEP36178.1 Dipeptide-binding ABC transporter, periplasmic substrate-binding component [Taylorella asinigenitalis MCE3]
MKKISQKALLTSILMGFTGIASAAGGTLVYCSEGSPAGFDTPQYTAGTDNDASGRNVFDNLLSFPRGESKSGPGLAESYEVSEDGLVYTFKLRKGVKWHSNNFFKPTREFNADDVVFTFDRLANKDNFFNKAYPATFPYYTDMSLDKIIKTVEKVDDYTVKMTLTKPDATLTQTLAMAFAVINSKEYAEQLVKQGKPELINQNPIGTGPFVFVRYQKDAQIRYKANKDYWDKNDMPQVDNLIFAITKDPSVRAQKLKAGECHIMSQPLPTDVAEFQKNDKLKVMQSPGFNVGYIAYNTEKKPFTDPKVRIALDMALNKKSILDAVYADQGQPVPNLMPETQWSFNKDVKVRDYDVEGAKKLLAEAGYPDGFEVELWTLPVSRPYNPNGRLMGELVQSDWAKIGVKVKLKTYEWGEYLKRAKNGEHQIVMAGWTGDNGDPDNWLGNLASCDAVGGSNYARFCFADFDKLIKEARSITDTAKRTELYEKAQVIFHEQTPSSTIATSIVSVPMSKNVEGFKISPFGAFEFNGVSIKK